MLHTTFAGEWLKALNSGFRTIGGNRIPCNRNDLVNHFLEMVNKYNLIEAKRVKLLTKDDPNKINLTVI